VGDWRVGGDRNPQFDRPGGPRLSRSLTLG